jgi:hypothetical protein
MVRPSTLNYKNGEETDNKSTRAAGDAVRLTMPDSLGKNRKIEVTTILPKGDLPGYKVTEADRKLMDVYGYYIHQNGRLHLDGDIQDDAAWQARWQKLTVLPCQHYDAPTGVMWHLFVHILERRRKGAFAAQSGMLKNVSCFRRSFFSAHKRALLSVIYPTGWTPGRQKNMTC